MENLLNSYASEFNISLSTSQLNLFNRYYDLLLEYNEKLNLTAITNKEEVAVKHFLDSISIDLLDTGLFAAENKSIIDVGSGGGFPGIPIAIKYENSNVTLLETIKKKEVFLESCIESLSLKNASALNIRAEDGGKDSTLRESYDLAVSRAVTSLPALLEYLLPFVKVGGLCICYKSSDIREELDSSKNSMEILGGSLLDIKSYSLPKDMGKRNLVIIKKESPTPIKYPRRAGIPTKRPL